MTPETRTAEEFIHQNIRVLRAMYDLNGGGLAEALMWFKNQPLREFAGKTAERLVAEGRVDDVIKLLEMYDAGAT